MTESSRRRPFVPNAEQLERIAAGESLRSLGRELGRAHTTLSRSLQRPEVASKLRAAQQRFSAQRAKERRAEKELRRRAQTLAASRGTGGKTTPAPTDFEALSAAGLVSRNDEVAAQAVEAGGGVQELIEATGLRTRLAVYESIDPQIVERARANDDRRAMRDPLDGGKSWLRPPDCELLTRRAGGEPLRLLAQDYGVSPSTMSRFFARPEVAKELLLQQRDLEKQRLNGAALDDPDVALLAAHYASKIKDVRCPVHHRRTYVRSVDTSDGDTRLEVAGCCSEAAQELVRWLKIHRATLSTGVTFTPSNTHQRVQQPGAPVVVYVGPADASNQVPMPHSAE